MECFYCSNSVLHPDGRLRCRFTNLLAIKLCVQSVNGNGRNISSEEMVRLNQKDIQKVTKQPVKIRPITKTATKKAKSAQQGKLL